MVFADKNLEAAVRKALEKPEEPLTKEVIRELTSLHTSMPLIETEIEVLFGIDSAVNLTKLNLCEYQINDVSPLASLTNLEYLALTNNKISDVSPLASLTNLTTLSLRLNPLN